MKSIVKLVLSLSFLFPFVLLAQSDNESELAPVGQIEEEFNPGKTIMHHLGDSHEWHFATIGETHVSVPLPVIIYSKEKGFTVFMSSAFHNATHSHAGYILDDHDHIVSENPNEIFYDLSVTKNVASLILSVVLMLLIFVTIANRYKKNPQTAPRGIQSFFEPVIMYIRDEVAKSMIGPKYERFMPYLLTVFFFIWFNNMLGLMPGAANVTGSIAVTMVLALFTLIITSISGNKYYWGHIFNPPGLPLPIKFLMVPIEVISIFIKPFSLTIRLFANITAGHIILLSLLSLIFIFKSEAASLISLPFALFMMGLELFVSLLQAYIFTLLSAMYIGAAVAEHAHENGELDKALF
jgi:F-type H+-transporting ATPase subunit a